MNAKTGLDEGPHKISRHAAPFGFHFETGTGSSMAQQHCSAAEPCSFWMGHRFSRRSISLRSARIRQSGKCFEQQVVRSLLLPGLAALRRFWLARGGERRVGRRSLRRRSCWARGSLTCLLSPGSCRRNRAPAASPLSHPALPLQGTLQGTSTDPSQKF